MNKLLSVSSLDVKFNLRDSVFHAVKNASFEISENEIVGLVGESGSGKSVTAMSLMRLLPSLRQSLDQTQRYPLEIMMFYRSLLTNFD